MGPARSVHNAPPPTPTAIIPIVWTSKLAVLSGMSFLSRFCLLLYLEIDQGNNMT